MNSPSPDPLSEFTASVAKQDVCIARGDSRAGNREARKYVAAARAMLAGGSAEIDRFATLLSHEHLSVRVMAAAFLLKDRATQAVAALKPIAAGSGLSALGAQMTLDRFARGDFEVK